MQPVYPRRGCFSADRDSATPRTWTMWTRIVSPTSMTRSGTPYRLIARRMCALGGWCGDPKSVCLSYWSDRSRIQPDSTRIPCHQSMAMRESGPADWHYYLVAESGKFSTSRKRSSRAGRTSAVPESDRWPSSWNVRRPLEAIILIE